MKIESLGNKVVVKSIPLTKTSKLGIVLSANEDDIQTACVLSIGYDVKLEIDIGDTVYVAWQYGTKVAKDTYIFESTSLLGKLA